MSEYFDHARCPQCGTAFDPEKVQSRGGELACPACGASLALASLFGLKDSFLEEEQPDLTLEDAVPEATEPTREDPGTPNLPARGIDTAPIGALDVLRQLKKKK